MTDYGKLFDLNGKAAIVVGAGGGIGSAIAGILGDFGADLLAADRDPERTRAAVEAVDAPGRRVHPFAMDVTSRADNLEMARTAKAEFGRVDILVYSAGMNIRKSILEIEDDDWDPVLNVNLKGILYACQAAAPYMIDQGGGKIVIIASISSILGHPARGAYAASKGGVIQLCKVMATEWASHNICVNAISPAAVDTPFIDGLKRDRQRLDRELERIPMGRIAVVDDIVGAALLFSSGASDFITGQNLVIDGGRTAD